VRTGKPAILAAQDEAHERPRRREVHNEYAYPACLKSANRYQM